MKEPVLLVTGGAGYIGSHMLLALKHLPYKVVVVDNLSTGRIENIVHGKFIQGDIRDKVFVEQLFQTFQFDAVIHFAASVSVPESMVAPENYFENNTVATLNLVQACTNHRVKNFLFSSTAAVYGHHATGEVDELSQPAPMNPYGQSKLLAEKILSDCFSAHHANYVIFRYFNVAGVDPSMSVGPSIQKSNHLLKAVVHTAMKQQPYCEIFGDDYPTPDGTGIRDFIHVSDLIEAHILALKAMLTRPLQETYNCSYGTGYSVQQVINQASTLFKHKINVKRSPRRHGDCAKMIAKPDKLIQELNWLPQHNHLHLMLDSLMRWEQKIKKEPIRDVDRC